MPTVALVPLLPILQLHLIMAIGPVLVTGGCGLLGSHLVQALLKDNSVGSITVVSRNPNNQLPEVDYQAGDIGDVAFVNELFAVLKPAVVFHTASPRPTDDRVQASEWTDTNVTGTQNLISAAQATPETKVFVFSSSVNVITGTEHVNVKEDSRPYWKMTDKALPYWRSKAEAERIALGANGEKLQVASIRPCMIIGTGEHALIPAQLDALKQGKTNIQLGDNKNLFDVVSTENCAQSHILAMHALLDPSKANGAVAGKAFNITDGNPLPFWDVQRIIWRKAGDKTELKDVTVIPGWAANAMAVVGELVYGILFFGSKNPELNRHVVNFCTRTFTYDIDKARKVLGYTPTVNTQAVIEEATQWEMDRRAQTDKSDGHAGP